MGATLGAAEFCVDMGGGLCKEAGTAWQAVRHQPFEHIYRHHRRYRITEGSEETQMRRVAGYMFGFMSQRAPKGVDL